MRLWCVCGWLCMRSVCGSVIRVSLCPWASDWWGHSPDICPVLWLVEAGVGGGGTHLRFDTWRLYTRLCADRDTLAPSASPLISPELWSLCLMNQELTEIQESLMKNWLFTVSFAFKILNFAVTKAIRADMAKKKKVTNTMKSTNPTFDWLICLFFAFIRFHLFA